MIETIFRFKAKRDTASLPISRRVWGALIAGMVVAVVSGCDTPYTRRVRELDEAYQRGNLSREDYMRFVPEEEQWNQGHTTEALWPW